MSTSAAAQLGKHERAADSTDDEKEQLNEEHSAFIAEAAPQLDQLEQLQRARELLEQQQKQQQQQQQLQQPQQQGMMGSMPVLTAEQRQDKQYLKQLYHYYYNWCYYSHLQSLQAQAAAAAQSVDPRTMQQFAVEASRNATQYARQIINNLMKDPAELAAELVQQQQKLQQDASAATDAPAAAAAPASVPAEAMPMGGLGEAEFRPQPLMKPTRYEEYSQAASFRSLTGRFEVPPRSCVPAVCLCVLMSGGGQARSAQDGDRDLRMMGHYFDPKALDNYRPTKVSDPSRAKKKACVLPRCACGGVCVC
jgi:hypothetical protein